MCFVSKRYEDVEMGWLSEMVKLYYSGHEVKKIEGVGILVRDDCCITIIQINYISSRMMSLFCKIDGNSSFFVLVIII